LTLLIPRRKLFGEDDEAGDETELEKAKADGENGKFLAPFRGFCSFLAAEEIDNLKKEAAAFREVRQKMAEADGARRVFEKVCLIFIPLNHTDSSQVFSEDIQRLLSMEDMWKVEGRVKPVPLEYESIMSGTFVTPPVRKAAPANGKSESAPENGKNGVEKAPAEVAKSGGLKDQRELSVKDNLELFIDR
jgi:ubiquitin-like 1-activating enzyme E1 B